MIEIRPARDRGRSTFEGLHAVPGSVAVNGRDPSAGDGAGIADQERVSVGGRSPDAEVWIFDLA